LIPHLKTVIQCSSLNDSIKAPCDNNEKDSKEYEVSPMVIISSKGK